MNQKPLSKADYLRFDAFSIKELILQNLGENKHFTDMVFEGSNLIPIIDIVSNLYQVLMYYINHGSAEAMFSDSQLYENINRIVKMLGYNPKGYSTAMVDAFVYGYPNEIARVLPKYSYVTVSGNDSRGLSKYYSTVDYYYIYPDTHTTKNNIVLYNGIWRLLNRTFVATGIPFETIMLNNLVSDINQKKYVPLRFIDVFVKRQVTSGYKWIKFSPVETGMFLQQLSTSVYKPTDRIFNVRLNENKTISLQFGDGITGERLQEGDEIYIAYLDSNGEEGIIGSNILNQSSTQGRIRYGIAGMNAETFNEITQDESATLLQLDDMESIYFINEMPSSTPQEEETVEQIKQNAPKWFNTSGILRSKDDFESYIISNFYANVDSVKIMNNWDYISSLYRWLYNLETVTGKSFLNPDLKSKYDYPWADACDFNNIYIFVKFKTATSISKMDIYSKINILKPMTSEIVFVDPLDTYFLPCAYYDEDYDINDLDTDIDNYIEALVDEKSLVSPEIVHSRVTHQITDFFKSENQKIGNIIDFNELNSKLLAIDGVQRIRTIYHSKSYKHPDVVFNGLRFVAFTRRLVDNADRAFITGSFKLEEFQFPVLLKATDLSSRIKVIVNSNLGLASPEF